MNSSRKTNNLTRQEKQIIKPKKNPRADVTRNESIYFAVGLLLILIVTYSTINYKSYDNNNIDIGLIKTSVMDDEVMPIIKEIKELPPPPPPVVPDIEIVPDDPDIIETDIASTETNESDKIAEIDDIIVIEEKEEMDIPFEFIENVPIYPGCENGNNDAKRKCMSEKISDFVVKKFNTGLAEGLGLSGKQRIMVIFKIDKKGFVTGVLSRAPHPSLEQEAARVIGLLPQMKPGKQRGNEVTVSYSLPIVFQVQD